MRMISTGISRRIGPRRNAVAACAAILAVAAGCKDSTTGPNGGDQLAPAEGEALAVAISGLTFDTAVVSGVGIEQGGRKELACSGGGTYAVDIAPARESESGDTTRLSATVTIEPKGCMVSSGSGKLELDGNPNVKTEVTATVVGLLEHFSVVARTTGAVRWKLGDRSGTCALDLTATSGLESAKTKVTGKLCGRDASFEMETGATTWIDL